MKTLLTSIALALSLILTMAAMVTSGTLACTFIGVLVGAPLFGWVVSGAGGYRWAFSLQGLSALGVAYLLWANRARFAQH